MLYIGIDNGVTGSISIINENKKVMYYGPIPIKKELSYTKTKQYITRIDTTKLGDLLWNTMSYEFNNCHCLIERPMINPMRFKASASALRALEATLVVLEDFKIPYEYIDSKEWQKTLLPKKVGIIKDEKNKKTNPAELKKAAVDIARRIFPSVKTKDADGLLIAEFLRRKNVGINKM